MTGDVCYLVLVRGYVQRRAVPTSSFALGGGGFGNDTAVEADLGGKQSTWDLLIHTELRG